MTEKELACDKCMECRPVPVKKKTPGKDGEEGSWGSFKWASYDGESEYGYDLHVAITHVRSVAPATDRTTISCLYRFGESSGNEWNRNFFRKLGGNPSVASDHEILALL